LVKNFNEEFKIQMDLNRLANFTKPERNELKEDQIVCDKCNGTGCVPSEFSPHELASVCQKCQGDGWVDWISNITGKPPRHIYSSSGTSISNVVGGIPNCVVNKMAEELASKIDKEILAVYMEQKTNHKGVFF
jgi:RecJ-like exonuclease